MKLFASPVMLSLCCMGCSRPSPHHLPDSIYYKQREVNLLIAVCGQVMKPLLYINPITKQDTIGIYDSLSFPHPSKKVMKELSQERKLSADFMCLLTDTINCSQAHHSTTTPPIRQIADRVSFTPKLVAPKDDATAVYRLSRVVFNDDFSKAYFQLTWTDKAGGISEYILCQRDNHRWVVHMAYTYRSFKI